MVPANPEDAFNYYNQAEGDSIYCNHSEVEDNIVFTPSHPVLDSEGGYLKLLWEEDSAYKVIAFGEKW